MSKIKEVRAREILDSRGNPALEVDLYTDHGLFRASVPSGLSKGSHEAIELRDNNKARYSGMGVKNAVKIVNEELSHKLIGKDVTNQKKIDELLCDLAGKQKAKLGGNVTLGVSIAVAKSAAFSIGLPFFEYIALEAERDFHTIPKPLFNVINGGRHIGRKDDVQEHMLVPTNAKSFSHALQMTVETFHALGEILESKFGFQGRLTGDEGGYAPPLNEISERFNYMEKALEEKGYKKNFKFAVDCAASEFYNKKSKSYKLNGKSYTQQKLLDYYQDLVKSYPLMSIEDGYAEDDLSSWTNMTKTLGKKIMIIGDDLLVTNPQRIRQAAGTKACNALLLKPNQIGTVTESIDAAKIAYDYKWNVIVSHRSGETEDTFIADMAVGLKAGYCKFGAPARGERVAKYNQLLRIEEDIQNAKYGL